VIVQQSATYVTASDYCVDAVFFDVAVITKPGDLAAEVDALDDLVDEIRSTLKTPSSAGYLYSFREVTGRTTFLVGERDMPAVIVTVAYERLTP
jgi:hypothetical protein